MLSRIKRNIRAYQRDDSSRAPERIWEDMIAELKARPRVWRRLTNLCPPMPVSKNLDAVRPLDLANAFIDDHHPPSGRTADTIFSIVFEGKLKTSTPEFSNFVCYEREDRTCAECTEYKESDEFVTAILIAGWIDYIEGQP